MALIPGTLPSDTCYGTPQDLLELFAQYLDVPAFALNSKVVFSTSSVGLTADVVWFDTGSGAPASATNPILKVTVSGGFVDYVNNYATNLAVVTTPAAGDYLLISQSSVLKKITYANLATSIGKVVQIVEGSTTTTVSTSSTSPVDTGLTVSITPTSASNKVLILIGQAVDIYRASSSEGVAFKLLRGATALYTGNAAASDSLISIGNSTTVQMSVTWNFQYLDSPSTTSATTYKLQGQTASGGTLQFQYNSARSSILAIEVTP